MTILNRLIYLVYRLLQWNIIRRVGYCTLCGTKEDLTVGGELEVLCKACGIKEYGEEE